VRLGRRVPRHRARGLRVRTVVVISGDVEVGRDDLRAGAKCVVELPVVLPLRRAIATEHVVLGPADGAQGHVPTFADPASRPLRVVLIADACAVVNETDWRCEATWTGRDIEWVAGGQRTSTELDLKRVWLSKSCNRRIGSPADRARRSG